MPDFYPNAGVLNTWQQVVLTQWAIFPSPSFFLWVCEISKNRKSILVASLIAATKYLTTWGNLMEEGLTLTHVSRVQFIRVEMLGEHEAADHIVVRKQGVMNAGAQLPCSFLFTSRPQAMACCSPELRWIVPLRLI